MPDCSPYVRRSSSRHAPRTFPHGFPINLTAMRKCSRSQPRGEPIKSTLEPTLPGAHVQARSRDEYGAILAAIFNTHAARKSDKFSLAPLTAVRSR
jgi:hypothetical protein